MSLSTTFMPMLILLSLPFVLAAPPSPDELDDFKRYRSRILESHRHLPHDHRSIQEMGWDIQHYSFHLRFWPDRKELEGSVSIEANRTTGGQFVLHSGGPQISDIQVNGQSVNWQNRSDSIILPTPDEESITVEAQWTSRSNRSTLGGLNWENNVIYSQNQPESARKWLISHDNPADKATLSWKITAPNNLIVAANGELLSTQTDNGWTTWNWSFAGQIPTYLMAVHLSEYNVLEWGDNLPITAWVYPGTEEQAMEVLGTTEQIIDHFSNLYGPYPWSRYGNAIAPMQGAVENTMVTTFGEDLIFSDWGEMMNAREIGHHWWGNNVTIGSWSDIWLNEGFASYSESLWYEQYYGSDGLKEYVDMQTESYREWSEAEQNTTVHDPSLTWGEGIHDKGAVILHMLRGIIGDDVFFESLRNYENQYRFSNAATSDFIRSVSETAGEDMSWFFDGWLYTVGEPIYTYEVQSTQLDSDVYQVDVIVSQDKTEFSMPLPIQIQLKDGTIIDDEVWVTEQGGQHTFCVTSPLEKTTIDPDYWLPLVGLQQGSFEKAPQSCPVPVAEQLQGCACSATHHSSGWWLGIAILAMAQRRRQSASTVPLSQQ